MGSPQMTKHCSLVKIIVSGCANEISKDVVLQFAAVPQQRRAVGIKYNLLPGTSRQLNGETQYEVCHRSEQKTI